MEDQAPDSSTHLLSSRKSYKTRKCGQSCLKSRGALVVVIWSCLFHCFHYYLALQNFIESNDSSKLRSFNLVSSVILAFCYLFYPVAGLLAETCCGRMKIMIAGNVLMMAAIVVYSPGLYFLNIYFYPDNSEINKVCLILLLIFSMVLFLFGLGIFEANVIQFGSDQLQFSSSEEYSKFIHWYYWSTVVLHYFSSVANILDNESNVQLQYMPYIQLVLLIVALVMVVVCYYKRVLIVEPVSHNNPLKQILSIMNYCRTHKQIKQRSAFAYGEMASWLDKAKTRFGGPFQTEQVEDVKSFWMITMVLLSMFGFLLANENTSSFLVDNVLPEREDLYNGSSATYLFATYYLLGPPQIGSVVVVIAIPVYELLIRPYLKRFTLTLLKRMGLGLVVSIMLLVTVAGMKGYIAYELHEWNMNCSIYAYNLWYTRELAEIPTVVFLVPIPIILKGISNLLVFMTALEFILAQAPRSMQGLLIGLWYAYQSLAVVSSNVANASSDLVERDEDTTCSFYWAEVVKAILAFISLILYILAASYYRYRLREELSDVNQKVIVEEYTERQLIRRDKFVPPWTVNESKYHHINDLSNTHNVPA